MISLTNLVVHAVAFDAYHRLCKQTPSFTVCNQHAERIALLNIILHC
jgi:hypothetical protein